MLLHIGKHLFPSMLHYLFSQPQDSEWFEEYENCADHLKNTNSIKKISQAHTNFNQQYLMIIAISALYQVINYSPSLQKVLFPTQ